jgi:hypothetical protein
MNAKQVTVYWLVFILSGFFTIPAVVYADSTFLDKTQSKKYNKPFTKSDSSSLYNISFKQDNSARAQSYNKTTFKIHSGKGDFSEPSFSLFKSSDKIFESGIKEFSLPGFSIRSAKKEYTERSFSISTRTRRD